MSLNIDHQKHDQEQKFLNILANKYSGRVKTLKELESNVSTLLALVTKFCGCSYAAFFANIHKGDTVLLPLASFGIPSEIQENPPHFNWKKAGLSVDKEYEAVQQYLDSQLETSEKNTPDVLKIITDEMIIKGFRGNNHEYFSETSCILPASLNTGRLGALVLGSFPESVNLSKELHFLINIRNTLSFYVFFELERQSLEQEREEWEIITKLFIHQLRSYLQVIATQIGGAKFNAKKLSGKTQVIEHIERAEGLCREISEFLRMPLENFGKFLATEIEPDDLSLELYPLSVLVMNCVGGSASEAERKHLRLVLDQEEKVETLPNAQIDITYLQDAINNMLSYAIKYSFPDTVINIHVRTDAVENSVKQDVIIAMDYVCAGIQEKNIERIFERGDKVLEQGVRHWSESGLWMTRAVVWAHGGEVGVAYEKTVLQKAENPAYKITITLTIPLLQRRRLGIRRS